MRETWKCLVGRRSVGRKRRRMGAQVGDFLTVLRRARYIVWERMDASGRAWPRAELRVGDADRQGVVVELQRHFVDGRLTSDELDERVAQALAARTFGELAVPMADLPVLVSPTQIEPRADDAYEHWTGFGAGPPLGAVMVLVGVMILLSMIALPMLRMGGMPFWPIFMLGFFFLGRPRRDGRRSRWHRGGRPTRFL